MQFRYLNIFDYELVVHQIPKNFYEDVLSNNTLDNIFNSKEIANRGKNSPEKNGEGVSTCGLSKRYITNIKNINPLLNYISECILKTYFKLQTFENKKIIFTRMWMNKIYFGCSGKCHVHNSKYSNSGTAIFYSHVPENASDLIILKKDIGRKNITKIHESISHYLKVKSGDLIIHSPSVPHGVSQHNNKEPRICFVFDFHLEDDSNQKMFKYQ